MKYRQGFVTNSSSTSFLCVFVDGNDFEEQKNEAKENFPEINIDLLFDKIEENRLYEPSGWEIEDYAYTKLDLRKLCKENLVYQPSFGNESEYPFFELFLNDYRHWFDFLKGYASHH